jgi:hypothetical protein
MAEGGDIGLLLTDVGGADTDTADNPAAGLLAPGQTTTTTLVTAAGNTELSRAVCCCRPMTASSVSTA